MCYALTGSACDYVMSLSAILPSQNRKTHVRVCVRACVCGVSACVRACVRVCVRVCVCMYAF